MNTFLDSTDQLRISSTRTHQNETKWELFNLRERFLNLGLEPFYQVYNQHIREIYISLFIRIYATTTILHCVLLLITSCNFKNIYEDIFVYTISTCIVFSILSVNFNKKYYYRRNVLYISSWISIALLVLFDFCVPCIHALKGRDILRPSYFCLILCAIYVFVPLPKNRHTLILGIAVTISYIVHFGVLTYRQHPSGQTKIDYTKIMSETFFLLCINLMGIYFRIMKEMAVRITILDRRLCVEENLLLHYARDQEKKLLHSIIPAQIANKIEQDVKVRIQHLKLRNEARTSQIREARKLFIQPHNDVSILFADVVNYTYLTRTLDVKTLMETIHDLFVKFDLASEEFNVLRIKFLGDCYYCVAGVPKPNAKHAKCCVDLGLRIIKDIRDVRIKRKLKIDMRIGVHSGNILSGVIGTSKWQFDIWSKAVDIANRLEQTGQAGRVHVSDQTLKLLEGEYIFEEGTLAAKSDPVLRKNHIHSFLIKPLKNMLSTDISRVSLGIRQQREKTDFSTHFLHAQDEIEEQMFRNNVTSIFLCFKDWRWEFLYMQEPDCLFKHSVAFSYIVFISIITIQSLNTPQTHSFWKLSVGSFVLFTVFLIVTWYKKIWIYITNFLDLSSRNKFMIPLLFMFSEKIESILSLRILTYSSMISIYSVLSLMQLMDCDCVFIENIVTEERLYQDGIQTNICVNAWAITECIILTLSIAFLFTRIPFIFKIVHGFFILIAYTVCACIKYSIVFEKSPTTNVRFHSELSHLLLVYITCAVFYLMNRQTEFLCKLDYNWKRQLQKKQQDETFTNKTIKILINNILPTHVADIYMSKQMKNELYYEEYDNVAVMFATIRNYDTEQVGLRVLNEIICDFDKVLNAYKGPLKIEKIKVAGWTYMAACGLDVDYGRRSHFNDSFTFVTPRMSVVSLASTSHTDQTLLPVQFKRQPSHIARQKGISNPQSNNVVYVLTQFALDIMRTMHSFNMENLQCEADDKDRGMLRIGISNGPVLAGVVGAYKPHYDIWGNAVNMASRMDSTGTHGTIQVTENTARILHTSNIKCSFRGLTFVKGRGRIPTFYVNLDEEMNFLKILKPDAKNSEFPELSITEMNLSHDELLDADSLDDINSPRNSIFSLTLPSTKSVVYNLSNTVQFKSKPDSELNNDSLIHSVNSHPSSENEENAELMNSHKEIVNNIIEDTLEEASLYIPLEFDSLDEDLN